MWFFRNWRRKRILARHLIASDIWQQACQQLPILHGLDDTQSQCLRERASLFLQQKHLTLIGDLQLSDIDRARLAALAQLPLLALAEQLDWYQGFHELILYPQDFVSPQRHRDPSGVEHQWQAEHSGEAWLQGPVILAWPGVRSSGDWDGYNLVIHELAHKLDMLNGDANGLPPLHRNMRLSDWSSAMQQAYDLINHQLELGHPPEIDPYAAENPAEFFAVTSEYFFSAPDILHRHFAPVYEQLRLFYRQDPLQRLKQLRQSSPEYSANPDFDTKD